jgi:hypothetical protein
MIKYREVGKKERNISCSAAESGEKYYFVLSYTVVFS